jgi:hypothetical protein
VTSMGKLKPMFLKVQALLHWEVNVSWETSYLELTSCLKVLKTQLSFFSLCLSIRHGFHNCGNRGTEKLRSHSEAGLNINPSGLL